ncbi:hypothetical protein RU07_02350 [Agrobacterium tumefaciens]|uniref:Uncharacterized protein n=1 Tax=Agrobacterium tumefaciens TaxID=358 RepID=A0A0D0L2G2_AGRTU|nr:hypothetical protein RU07_02350 [Agrobacterium tumefaciens]
MSCECCDYIRIGDIVEHKMNTNVFGIVIAEAGSIRSIRTSPTLAVMNFHEWELRHVASGEPEPPAKEDDETNVVRVDFNKGQVLTAETPTEGVA